MIAGGNWCISHVQYPFTQQMLQDQFPPQAPLTEALKSLLGDCGQHWFDLNASEPGPQVVPLECCKVTLRQLTKISAQLVDKAIDDATEETSYTGLISASKAWQHQSAPYAAAA